MCVIGDVVRVRDVPRKRPVRAFKAFTVEPTGKLSSPWYYSEWERGVPQQARASRSRRFVQPSKRNKTGFWSFKTETRCRKEFSRERALVVFLWGRVVEHVYGYRAEYCYIARTQQRQI